MGHSLRKLVLFVLFLAPEVGFAKTLHVRLAAEPSTLDWNGQVAPAEAPVVVNICEGLLKFEFPGEKLVPGVAESVTHSKDFQQYTFKLRANAKWSDGQAISAQDFVDSWTRTISPQSSSNYSYYLFDVKNAREFHQDKMTSISEVGMKAVDDRTLVVNLSHPVKNWEVLTTFWPFFPVRKDMIQKYGNNWWRAGVVLSSGPFVAESYQPGVKIVLKRNPYYPNPKSNVDEVDYDFIVSHETALQKYDAKELLLLTNLPLSGIKNLSRRADFHEGGILKTHMISANVDRYPMSNREFRLAVMQAIDPAATLPKDALQFKQAMSLVPPPLEGSQSKAFLKFDVKSAKEHLKKSGVVLDRNFKFQIVAATEEPFSSSAIEIKNQLEKNLGLNVKLMIYDHADLTAFVALRDFHLIDHSQTLKMWTPGDVLRVYTSDSLANERHYSNPAYDQWIQLGKWKEAQETLIATEGVSLPLYYESNAYLMRPGLKGVYLNALGLFVLKDAVVE